MQWIKKLWSKLKLKRTKSSHIDEDWGKALDELYSKELSEGREYWEIDKSTNRAKLRE